MKRNTVDTGNKGFSYTFQTEKYSSQIINLKRNDLFQQHRSTK